MKAVFKKVVACREDLDIEYWLVFILPFHFAQVGCLPVDQQVLEEFLALRAADLHLKVAATGGPSPVVGSPTGGCRAWVGIGHDRVDRQRAARRGRRRQVAAHHSAAIHQLKVIAAELPRLGLTRWRGDRTLKTMRLASGGAVGALLQVTARYMNARIRPQLVAIDMQWTKFDPLGVAQEPRTVVVLLALEHRDTKLDVEGAALPTEASTVRCVHRGPVSGKGEGWKVARTTGSVI